ncbi:MAG: outer membrane protein [Acidobacteriota bacterium]|jgi:outer membrane protein|nr:outer membrane protein [Acidobacteriota bacterium]
MSKPCKSLLLLLLLTLAAPPLHAEPLRLTLPEAVSMAMREGTVARLAQSQTQRAEISRREALSGLLPQSEARIQRYSESINLATFGFELPGQPPVIGPFDVYDAQVTAAVQLFNLAALRYYQASRAGVEASRWHLQQAQNDVTVSVARLYVMVQRADAQVASRQANVRLFEELLRVAKDEFEVGTGTRLDVAQANVQLSRVREALLRAQNDRESARLALLSAIGADQSQDVVLVPLTAPGQAPALDAALASARASRPELKEVEAAEKQAELTLESAKARRVPRIELNFLGDYAGNSTDEMHSSRRIAAGVAVPIFRGDIPANIARARLEVEDIRTRAAAASRDVEQQVRTSIMTLQNAEARVTVAGESAKVAEEALTIARDRKAAGYGSPVEVDRAEDAYRQAQEDLIAAQADAALAAVQVQYATGTIGGSPNP